MNRVFKQALLVMIVATVLILPFFLKRDRMNLKTILPTITKTLNKGFLAIKMGPEEENQGIFGNCSIRRTKSWNCPNLFRTVTEKYRKYQYSSKDNTDIEECSLKKLIGDCPKLRSEHGYEDKPVSESELEFPLAFAIKMHSNSIQVERLLRTIYRPHNFYCIHVDSKASNETYNLIKGVAGCFKNVVVLTERFNVIYASIRLVMAEFACMRCCMESGVKWKYYINLTGQEFMLKTNLELVEILKVFNGTNDIETDRFWIWWRHRNVYKITGDKLIKTNIPYPKFKSDIKIYKGSAYGMFSRDFVDFILTDDVVKPIFNWLSNTFSPDECIWATLNLLPFAPGGYKGFFTNHERNTHPSKAVNWIWDTPKVRCYGKHVRNLCIFGVGDLVWLRSRPEVAANKFYEDFDSVVLDCLEEWLNNKTRSATVEVNWYYYLNLPQVKYSQRLKPYQKTKAYWKQEKEKWLKTNKVILET